MSSPYVTWAPSEVGPCTATWFVGTDSGSPSNDAPGFGPATIINPTAAWDYLVDGPLKDVLTASYASVDAAVEAFAQAGGQVDVVALNASGTAVYGTGVSVIAVSSLPGPMFWVVDYDSALYPAVAQPLRWVVKFSVPHSIIR